MSRYIPKVCENVELKDQTVYDTKTERSFNLNPVSTRILEYCDGKADIDEIAEKICSDCEVEGDAKKEVHDDVLSFIEDSNSKYLLNCKEKGAIGYLKSLFFAQKHYKRTDINSNSLFITFLKELSIVMKVFGGLIIVTALSLAMILIGTSLLGSPDFTKFGYRFTGIIFALFIGFFTGIALHETIHVYIYRRKEPLGGFMVSRGFSIKFVRKVFNESILTKLCGGGITGLIGVIGIILYVCGIGVFHNLYFLCFSIAYAVQLLNFLPFGGDGRDIIVALLKKHLKV